MSPVLHSYEESLLDNYSPPPIDVAAGILSARIRIENEICRDEMYIALFLAKKV